MSQPHDRIFNFSAGPCTLPVSVLEEARDDLLNWKGAGMSVMEMSHRGKAYESIHAEAQESLRQLMAIPEEYVILFLQGGASMQNTMVPMNFRGADQAADYVIIGSWGKRSFDAAALMGKTNKIWDGKDTNYSKIPDFAKLAINGDSAYVHFTSNETIQGVEIFEDRAFAIPVVCDMSSDILSRPVDVSKYAFIYAGAQKNMGPAGVTVAICRKDMLERVPTNMQPMLDLKLLAENDSLYNTPPCWSIYMCGLVYKWMLANGGLKGAQERNRNKANTIYEAIDSSGGFYTPHAEANCRSIMNVTFTLPSEELTNQFVKEATAQKMDGLKGHRSVGGCRASIYNAFPYEGCLVLADFMKDFAARNG